MNNEFKISVLKALKNGYLSKVEAKKCLKSGFDNQELSLFDDFDENHPIPFLYKWN